MLKQILISLVFIKPSAYEKRNVKSEMRYRKGFKDIKGYDNLYKISEYGKIINYSGKELKGYYGAHGYKMMELSAYGKQKTYTVHGLVAMTYILNPENKPIIHHKNHLKYDNRVKNLEWVTRSENAKYAIDFYKNNDSQNETF